MGIPIGFKINVKYAAEISILMTQLDKLLLVTDVKVALMGITRPRAQLVKVRAEKGLLATARIGMRNLLSVSTVKGIRFTNGGSLKFAKVALGLWTCQEITRGLLARDVEEANIETLRTFVFSVMKGIIKRLTTITWISTQFKTARDARPDISLLWLKNLVHLRLGQNYWWHLAKQLR